MATINGDNFQKSQDFPKAKTAPGELNTGIKYLHERYDTSDAQGAGAGGVLAVGDKIAGPKLPEGAKILDSHCLIDQTAGATGIIDAGLEAFKDKDGNTIAADPNGLNNQCDAGGQAVFQRADNNSPLIGKKVGKGGAQVSMTCTEIFATNNPVIDLHVYYALED